MTQLPELRDFVDGISKDLAKIEPYWRKCFPCKNKGRCCNNSDIGIPDVEWKSIVEFLSENKDVIEYAKIRARNSMKCIFYNHDAKSCLIHPVRPINCRFAPYHIAYDAKKRGFFYHMCNEDCSKFLEHYDDNITPVTEHIAKVKTMQGDIRYLWLEMIKEITSFAREDKWERMTKRFVDEFCEER